MIYCDHSGTYATFDPFLAVEDDNKVTASNTSLRTGSNSDVGIQQPLPPLIDDYFNELLIIDALTLENKLQTSYGYYYNAFKGNEALARDCAFNDTVAFFVIKVETGGDWDLKNTDYFKGRSFLYQGKEYSAEDLGNIHFGYVGAVLFRESVLHVGAGLYQIYSGAKLQDWATFFDSSRDYDMIAYGYKLYIGGR